MNVSRSQAQADGHHEKTGQQRNASISLRRALAILETVRAQPAEAGGLPLTQIAATVGVNKSTALRLATPLVEAGLLHRERDSGRFRLGSAALALGQAYLDQLDLRSVAAPHLRALMRRTEHTCHLVVLEGLEVVYADKVENTATVRMASRIGARMPAHRTAVGKAMLAHSPPDLTDDVLETGLWPVTGTTITDPEVFRRELDKIRGRGYAIDDRENEPEVRCVAAPVFDHNDDVAAAISVSALASQLPAARVRELGPEVAQVAAAVSADLGARHHHHS